MEELELKKLAHVPASSLSHGQQRLVEIGCAWRPNRALAGLGLADVARISELLMRLKDRYTILLV